MLRNMNKGTCLLIFESRKVLCGANAILFLEEDLPVGFWVLGLLARNSRKSDMYLFYFQFCLLAWLLSLPPSFTSSLPPSLPLPIHVSPTPLSLFLTGPHSVAQADLKLRIFLLRFSLPSARIPSYDATMLDLTCSLLKPITGMGTKRLLSLIVVY